MTFSKEQQQAPRALLCTAATIVWHCGEECKVLKTSEFQRRGGVFEGKMGEVSVLVRRPEGEKEKEKEGRKWKDADTAAPGVTPPPRERGRNSVCAASINTNPEPRGERTTGLENRGFFFFRAKDQRGFLRAVSWWSWFTK